VVTPAERFAAIDRLITRLAADLPAPSAIGRARGLACRMVKHVRGGAQIRELVGRAPSIEAMRELLHRAAELAAADPGLAA
jgi:hypothetical protein